MWYSQGTVAVTNGGTNITGTGTSFLSNARVGDGITITGSTALHEIIGVTSNTQLSIRPAYAGTTGSGRTYGISPLLGYDKDLSDAFNQLRLQFGDQLSNLQPWATSSTEQEARSELGASSSGSTLFTGTLSQAQSHLQVQNVAGRGVVGGSRDLMAEGAFGLGGSGVKIVNPNNATLGSIQTSGQITNAEGVANNWPDTGNSNYAWWNLYTYGDPGRQTQEATFCFADRGNVKQGDKFTRVKQDSTWTEWRKGLHSDTVVGTVSQSGGVPTGAIIERGSNANGRYTKYADGTLICDNSNNPITTNPATFVGAVTSLDGSKLRFGRWY